MGFFISQNSFYSIIVVSAIAVVVVKGLRIAERLLSNIWVYLLPPFTQRGRSPDSDFNPNKVNKAFKLSVLSITSGWIIITVTGTLLKSGPVDNGYIGHLHNYEPQFAKYIVAIIEYIPVVNDLLFARRIIYLPSSSSFVLALFPLALFYIGFRNLAYIGGYKNQILEKEYENRLLELYIKWVPRILPILLLVVLYVGFWGPISDLMPVAFSS
jgi:hypothetical protein